MNVGCSGGGLHCFCWVTFKSCRGCSLEVEKYGVPAITHFGIDSLLRSPVDSVYNFRGYFVALEVI